MLPSNLKCCHANLILLQVSEMRARRGQKNEDSEGEIMMLCIHLSFALLYFYDNACCRKYKSRKLNFLRLKENTVHYKTEREHCPLLGTSWGSHPTNGLQKVPFSVQKYFVFSSLEFLKGPTVLPFFWLGKAFIMVKTNFTLVPM